MTAHPVAELDAARQTLRDLRRDLRALWAVDALPEVRREFAAAYLALCRADKHLFTTRPGLVTRFGEPE
jgi:hypothetical protein